MKESPPSPKTNQRKRTGSDTSSGIVMNGGTTNGYDSEFESLKQDRVRFYIFLYIFYLNLTVMLFQLRVLVHILMNLFYNSLHFFIAVSIATTFEGRITQRS